MIPYSKEWLNEELRRFIRQSCGLENKYPDSSLVKEIEALQHTLEKDPKDASARCTLGVLELLKLWYRMAINDLRLAVSDNPENALAHYYLAVCLYVIPEDLFEEVEGPYDSERRRASLGLDKATLVTIYLDKALQLGLPRRGLPYVEWFYDKAYTHYENKKDDWIRGYDPIERGLMAELRDEENRKKYEEFLRRMRRSEGFYP